MALYKADVFLGSNSGYQTVEVHSSSYNGVSEQICNIYNVNPNNIRNIRQSSKSQITEYSDDAGGTLTLIGLGIFVCLFALYTPYILMLTFGAGSGWLATKITGKTTNELFDDTKSKAIPFVLVVSILSGGAGIVVGKQIQQRYIDAPSDTSQTVHQVTH